MRELSGWKDEWDPSILLISGFFKQDVLALNMVVKTRYVNNIEKCEKKWKSNNKPK